MENTNVPEVGKEESSAQEQYEQMKESVESDTVSEHKGLAILGYILPFLFFLPLVNEKSKHNEFARFHANQHLILLIAIVGLYVVHNLLYMMLFLGGLFLSQLINLAFLVFMVLGIINAVKGEMKELPLIGGFNLLK